jgi:hypothetical protein
VIGAISLSSSGQVVTEALDIRVTDGDLDA